MKENWSFREMKRQIVFALFQRIALYKSKKNRAWSTVVFALNITNQRKFLSFELISLIMVVERTNKEVIIRLPASVDTEDLQVFLNYARYKELTADIKIDHKK